MRIVLWITLFCLVVVAIERAADRYFLGPAKAAVSPEVRIVTDPKIEKRVEALEAKVKTIEEHLQRRGSRY